MLQAISLTAFTIHHLFGNAVFGAALNPPATVIIGALLGGGLCYVGDCPAKI